MQQSIMQLCRWHHKNLERPAEMLGTSTLSHHSDWHRGTAFSSGRAASSSGHISRCPPYRSSGGGSRARQEQRQSWHDEQIEKGSGCALQRNVYHKSLQRNV